MRTITCNLNTMKKINRLRVMNLLNTEGPLSRIKLTKKSKLDGKTVTSLTKELIGENLVSSVGFESSSGGRCPELLDINADAKQCIGLYMDGEKILGVLSNLKGKILTKKQFPLKAGASGKTVIDVFKKSILPLAEQAESSKLLGIGIAVQGIMDANMEKVIQSTLFPSMEGMNLKKILRKIYHVPIEIEDVTRSKALAEKWFGVAKKIDNFILLDMGMGIGCAIFAEGHIHYGEDMSSGELGHTIVNEGGDLCHCGHRGCLETVASLEVLEKRIKKELALKSISLKEIIEMLHEENTTVKTIVCEIGHYIGLSISNVVNVIHPSHIILGGSLAGLGNILFDSIDDALRRFTMPSFYNNLKLVPAKFGDEGASLGAATLLLRKIFEMEELM